MSKQILSLIEYNVCDLTLLKFNTYQSLISQEIQRAIQVSPASSKNEFETLQFTLQRIGLELSFKLNEFVKS